MTVALPLSEWQELGVRLPSGGPLPKADIEASLVSGRRGDFLVYRNYDALLDYNCANAYALGVALLAERIAGPAPPEPKKKVALRARKRQLHARKRHHGEHGNNKRPPRSKNSVPPFVSVSSVVARS